jgi:hypothetical protein
LLFYHCYYNAALSACLLLLLLSLLNGFISLVYRWRIWCFEFRLRWMMFIYLDEWWLTVYRWRGRGRWFCM